MAHAAGAMGEAQAMLASANADVDMLDAGVVGRVTASPAA